MLHQAKQTFPDWMYVGMFTQQVSKLNSALVHVQIFEGI